MKYKNNAIGKVTYLMDNSLLSKEKLIMEVGGGNGLARAYLRSSGYKILSTDINNKLPYFNIESSVPDRHYDLIFGLGVLHHLKQPEQAFNRLKQYTDELIFIEPPKTPLHILVAFQPSEWTRFKFFRWNPKGQRTLFYGKFNIEVPQTIIHWKSKEEK